MLDKYFQPCYYQIVNNRRLRTNLNLYTAHSKTTKLYNISMRKHKFPMIYPYLCYEHYFDTLSAKNATKTGGD